MVDWRQFHISLEVGTRRKLLGGDGKKSMELDVKIVFEKQGIWGIKLILRQSPVTATMYII